MPASCTSPTCDTISLLVTLAQLGQFLPQHWEMMSDKNVVGVSPYLLFFNSLYTLLAAIDILLLDGYQTLTCSESPYRCFIDAQPIIQMIGSAFLCITMWYWFLKYHHRLSEADDEEQRLFQNFFYNPHAEVFYQSFLASSVIFTLLAIALVMERGISSELVKSYAHFCGILSAILNGVMWIPQIIVTASLGRRGALAIGWVFLSVVMDVTYSIYLAFMGAHWTVWANNVPDGIQTSILLVLLLRLEYIDHSNKREYQQLANAEQGAANDVSCCLRPFLDAHWKDLQGSTSK